MALQNPAALYTGGRVNLNPLPYVKIALQARAKKQAREDALDSYYRKLPDTLNDKGVRDQEIPVINDYKQKIFEYGLKNKEALRNPKIDNGAAQLGLDKMFREAQGVTRESQNAAKRNLVRGKMWWNKDNQHLLNNDDYMNALHFDDLPVNHPDYKPLDDEKFLGNRPFDQSTFIKQIKTQFPYGEEVSTQQDPNDKLYDIVTTSPKLDAKTKEGIYAFAADKLHNDYTFKNKIQKNLDPNQLTALNEISQKTFGKPIENDEDLAAAYTVSQLPVSQVKEKRQADTGAVMDKRSGDANKEWDRRNTVTFKQSMQKIAANKAAGLPPEDLGYLSDNVADEAGEDVKVKLGKKESTRRVIYVDKVDPDRLNIIIGKDPSQKKFGVKPIPIKVPNADGSVTVKMGYYQDPVTGDWEGLDGQKISRERVKDAYINKYAPSKFKAGAGTKAAEEKKYELD